MLKIVEGRDNKVAYKKASNIVKDTKRAINLAYEQIADSLKRKVIFDLDDKASKTGRIYFIVKDGQTIRHQASAPGEPPATLFGNLKRSVGTKVNGSDTLKLSAGNEQRAPYARRLELGDDLVAKRPYLIKAIRDEQRNTETYFRKLLEEKLGKINEA